jgi:enoyl-CoA hydratase / long-chain 3-hydroxyacyl-CoA dehydrogenase
VGFEKLDKVAKNFGMPLGPLELADNVGIDVISHVSKFLSDADLGVRMSGGDVTLMEKMIDKGWLGKKAGKGFYTYDGKNKSISADMKAFIQNFTKQDLGLHEDEIENRLMSRFINEAAKCLEDEIIADPIVGDMGMVFGTGFAPFRGGPFRFLDTIGIENYVGTMNDLSGKYGPQFEPCQILKDYAASNKKFHRV